MLEKGCWQDSETGLHMVQGRHTTKAVLKEQALLSCQPVPSLSFLWSAFLTARYLARWPMVVAGVVLRTRIPRLDTEESFG